MLRNLRSLAVGGVVAAVAAVTIWVGGGIANADPTPVPSGTPTGPAVEHAGPTDSPQDSPTPGDSPTESPTPAGSPTDTPGDSPTATDSPTDTSTPGDSATDPSSPAESPVEPASPTDSASAGAIGIPPIIAPTTGSPRAVGSASAGAGGGMPTTGVPVATYAGAGTLLVVLGAVAFIAARRRRNGSTDG